MSKTPVSPHQAVSPDHFRRICADIHVQNAFHDFIETSVTEMDLTSSILPTVEKSVLRSPEISLLGMLIMHMEYPGILSSGSGSNLRVFSRIPPSLTTRRVQAHSDTDPELFQVK